MGKGVEIKIQMSLLGGKEMLTQAEVDDLLQVLKSIISSRVIPFPGLGQSHSVEVASHDGRERFIVDINRKGSIKPTKCTFQERYRKEIILLRLDIEGPPHTNPNGTEIPCPHLHIFREGYGNKWAFPIDALAAAPFSNTANLAQTFREFLEYCQVTNIRDIIIIERLLS